MRNRDIRIGRVYEIRVSGRLTAARVLREGKGVVRLFNRNSCAPSYGERVVVRWYVENLRTGRMLKVSAARLRREVSCAACGHYDRGNDPCACGQKIRIETRSADQDRQDREAATHCARCNLELAPFDPSHTTADKGFRWLSALTDRVCCSLDCAEAIDFHKGGAA